MVIDVISEWIILGFYNFSITVRIFQANLFGVVFRKIFRILQQIFF